MNPIHSDALGDAAVNAYERLRTRILEAGARSTDELGLAVLLRNGMLAWLRAHASVFSEVRAARDVPEPARVSMQVHDELVQVMVAIAMNAMPTSPAAAVPGP